MSDSLQSHGLQNTRLPRPLLFPRMHESEKWKWSPSVVSDSVWPHGLQPTRLLCPWDFPGKSTGEGCYRLLRFLPYFCLKNLNCLSLCSPTYGAVSLTINSGPISAVSACLKQQLGNFSSNLGPGALTARTPGFHRATQVPLLGGELGTPRGHVLLFLWGHSHQAWLFTPSVSPLLNQPLSFLRGKKGDLLRFLCLDSDLHPCLSRGWECNMR